MSAPKKHTKMYVLDTNVLLLDPTAIFAFKKAFVGIPAIVLEELDKFKKEASDRGRNTREAIRQLDEMRTRGSLKDGVRMENGGTIKVLFMDEGPELHLPFKLSSEDNQILLTAISFREQGYDVVFISKDINARVKADALGLPTEDYLKEHVTQDDFYHGWVRVQVPAVELKSGQSDVLIDLKKDYNFELNSFILLESQHNPHNNRVFRYLGGDRFKLVEAPRLKWPLVPRNPQQIMALDLLLDDSIPFVTLFGPAGTGKTFISLLAGMHKVLIEDVYRKMLISRPVVPLGRDIGYLPGTMEEKLHSWMLPIYDNMDFIAHSARSSQQEEEVEAEQRGEYNDYRHHNKSDKYSERSKHHGKKHGKDRHHDKEGKKGHKHHQRRQGGISTLDELIHRGKVSLEAITYMRGRSIPYQFILIDEAQNLTPHEVKTIVTRVGDGSKVVLVGDPYQIDSPYMDFSSNGLVRSSERFKGQPLFGSVYLETSERSPLSKMAGELL